MGFSGYSNHSRKSDVELQALAGTQKALCRADLCIECKAKRGLMFGLLSELFGCLSFDNVFWHSEFGTILNHSKAGNPFHCAQCCQYLIPFQ